MPSSSRRFPPARSRRTTCWSTISTTSSNLQGTGTTIIDYNPSTEDDDALRQAAAELAAMSRRHRPDHGDDDAEQRLGDRRQHAEHRRHHRAPRATAAFWSSTPTASSRPSGRARISTARGATWRRIDNGAKATLFVSMSGSTFPAPQVPIRDRVSGGRQQGDGAAHRSSRSRQASRRKSPSQTVIASGFGQRADKDVFLIGPTGLALIGQHALRLGRASPTASSRSRTRRRAPQRRHRPRGDQGWPVAAAAGAGDDRRRPSSAVQRARTAKSSRSTRPPASSSTRNGSTPIRRNRRPATAIFSASRWRRTAGFYYVEDDMNMLAEATP